MTTVLILMLLIGSIGIFASNSLVIVQESLEITSAPEFLHFGKLNKSPVFSVTTEATITTDRQDYKPGDVALITGSGFSPGEIVTLQVVHVEQSLVAHAGHEPWDVTADSQGNVSAEWLVQEDSLGQTLELTAYGNSSGARASHIFYDSAAANLDQCRNGSATAPRDCTAPSGGEGWVNGNAGSSNSHFVEGYSIPYRVRMTELTPGVPVTIELGYDVKHGGGNAIDYLTSNDRLQPHTFFGHPAEQIFPIDGVSGTGSFDDFDIPAPPASAIVDGVPQPQTSFNSLPAIQRKMRIYGGDITAMSYGPNADLTADNSEQTILITFTPDSATAVLTWGGHIAKGSDWDGNSAGSISGSPYHMRLKDWTCPTCGNLGNQDRSLSADAVVAIGTLIFEKQVIGGNGGLFSFSAGPTTITNFQLNATPNTIGSITFNRVPEGTYNASETGNLPGYTLFSATCSSDQQGDTSTPGNITLNDGETITCRFVNRANANLTLVKQVVNDNGGTAVAGDFTLSASGPTPISGAGGVSSTVDPGTYSLSETNVSGYTASQYSCSKNGGAAVSGNSITLAAGDSAVCTITNDDNAPSLTLNKVVVNDNGGTAVAANFTLTASGPTGFSGAGPTVSNGASFDAGTYNLSETNLPGYTASQYSCSTNGGPAVSGNSITLGLGDSGVCTITNDDNAPSLTLNKVVINDNGGTAIPANFTLSAAGPTGFSGAGPTVSNGASFDSGTYNLSETNLPGYTASQYSCSKNGGAAVSGNSITLGLGDSGVCTITNDDNAPSLTLNKVVVNDNGGTALASDFTLIASGPTGFSGAGPSVSNGASFDAGTYNLSETNLPGYTASQYSCSKNGGPAVSGNSINLGLGDSGVCTITNNDNAPSLVLRKVVVNDNGGTALASDFTLTATGPTGFSGAGPTVNNGASFDAGVYNLSESNLPGYTATQYSCSTNGGPAVSGNSITLGLGDSGDCTITNDDNAPSLTLNKVVVNDNGGTALASDFTLTAAGPTGFSGAGPTVSNGASFDAGVYNLSESNLPGYTASQYSCSKNGGPAVSGNSITLGLGDSGVCTITNDDNAASLILRKVVINDNGGTATPANFTLTATGPTGFSGAGPTVNNGPSFDAGVYNLSETNLPGYTASQYSCSKNGGPAVSGNSINLGLGDSGDCTITNDDNAPSLTLNKVVVNDNGGTAVPADFTLAASGPTGFSGAGPTVSNGASFDAGVYNLSETNLYGYTASQYSCSKNGGPAVSGNSITLGLGESGVCTVTNDDQPGRIVVQKVIKPTGSQTSFSFDATGTGYNDFSLAGGQTDSQTLDAGNYSVKELVPLGWVLTGIGGSSDINTPYNCTITGSGGSTGIGDLNTQTATISLKNGDTVTCVFENTGQGVTRTQGFWATHPQLANIAWFGGTAFGHTFPGVAGVSGIGDTMLCGRNIDTLGKLMGGFWSDVSKTSTGAKRSALDQARMQLLQQLLAAELNGSAFGTVPSSGSFAAWESAYCGSNQNAIKTAQQQAASFNSQGDSSTFTPGTSADSKSARQNADYVFWNILP